MAGPVPCDRAVQAGRLETAVQFHEQAEVITTLAEGEGDVLDAAVTLLVHAGIAAADVICCARLGQHARGQDHREAIDLLARADRSFSKDLAVLLGLKTKAGYSAVSMSNQNHTRASRAAARLVEAAQRI
ncbi:hypothetical protein BH24ACT4_BH24ACT4_19070 [soil metagenome]